MASPRVALLLLAGILTAAAGGAAAETADCRAQLKQREVECRNIAEKRSSLCPDAQAAANPARAAECRMLSDQLKNLCTRRPCGAPVKKAKAKKAKPKKAAPKKPPAKSG